MPFPTPPRAGTGGTSLRAVGTAGSDVERVTEAIAEACEAGSPVAARDEEGRQHMAALAVRRWNSFERRASSKRAGPDERIEDLAKGVRDAYESDPALVGPLMEDYRWLAGRIAAALGGR